MSAQEPASKKKIEKAIKPETVRTGTAGWTMESDSGDLATAMNKLANPASPPINPDEILALQRTVGNRLVQRLCCGQAPDSAERRFQDGRLTDVIQRDPTLTEAERAALTQMAEDMNTLSQSLNRLNSVLERGEQVVNHMGRENEQAIIASTRTRLTRIRSNASRVSAITSIARDAANLDAALARVQDSEGDAQAIHAVSIRLTSFGQTLAGQTDFFNRSGINFLGNYVSAVIRGATACGAAGIRVFAAYHARISEAMMGEAVARGVDRLLVPVIVSGRVDGLDRQARRDLRVILNNVRAFDRAGRRMLMPPEHYRRMSSVQDDGSFVINVRTEMPTDARRMEGDVLYIPLYGTSERDTIELVRVGNALHGNAPDVTLEG